MTPRKPQVKTNCKGKEDIPEHLFAEWSDRNEKPLSEYFKSSPHKGFWKCVKDNRHPEWSARILNRALQNAGCLYCSGSLPWLENSLLFHDPQTAAHWDYEKNDKGPSEFLAQSQARVFWRCLKNSTHRWENSIQSQANKHKNSKCSFCANKEISNEYNLATEWPEVAAEWDYENNLKGPEDYFPWSKARTH